MMVWPYNGILVMMAVHLVAEVTAQGRSTTYIPPSQAAGRSHPGFLTVDQQSLVSAHKARANKRFVRQLRRRNWETDSTAQDDGWTESAAASPDNGFTESAASSEDTTTQDDNGWTVSVTATSLLASRRTSTTASAPASTPTLTNSGRSGYPFSSVTFESTSAPYVAPSIPLKEWWSASFYGFLGFSYPLEDSSCPSASDLSTQFASMKQDFGATVVRIYSPGCRDASLWEALIDAAVENSIAVVFQIWWGFDADQSEWKTSVESLKTVLASEDYGAIAPYVVQSVEFGSEPIGDGVDGGPDGGFLDDLASFKAAINAFGIPVGISEDWDRPGTMSSSDGTGGLGPVGTEVLANSDVVHAHIMPYCHWLDEQDSWEYVKSQLAWYHANIPSSVPVLISESMWAWDVNPEHGGGMDDVGPSQYAAYWKSFDDNCELFSQYSVGWFIHTWQGEGTFDMAPNGGGGVYEIPGWRPRQC